MTSVEKISMADTRQCVSWALERQCPFRNGVEWELPNVTATRLNVLKATSRALISGSICDGICVTSWTVAHGASDDPLACINMEIPYGGFVVEEQLLPYGDLATITSTCGNCEANVDDGSSPTIAGCHGHVSVSPDSGKLETALTEAVKRTSPVGAFEKLFLKTSPMWYGLWATSPLSPEQAAMLIVILSHVFEPADRSRTGIHDLLLGLRASIEFDLPMHVALAPPGHTDFGYYTVFAHCPRCKAGADLPRWREHYPQQDYSCHSCGQHYYPADTHRRSEMNNDDVCDRLEVKLGTDRYALFVRKYLAANGWSEQEAAMAWKHECEFQYRRKLAAERQLAGLSGIGPPCPSCGKPLRTTKAKQCFQCGADWHAAS